MPKVPRAPSSIDRPVIPLGPRQDVGQAGLVGRAVSGFGQTIAEQGFKIQRRREETLILDHITGLSGWQREFDAEYQSRKGSDAWGIADELKDKYEERLKGIDKLSGSRWFKDTLKQKVSVYREHAMNKAAGYVALQDRVFKIQTFKNGRQGIIDDVQANFNNPKFIKERFADLEKMANDAFYPELAEAQFLAAKDEALEAAIERAMLTDPELAREMLDEYRDDLLDKSEERLETKLKAALKQRDTAEEISAAYNTLFQKHDGDPDDALKDLADPETVKRLGLEVAEKVKLMFRGIRADEARREAEEKQVEVEAREATNKDFVNKFSVQALTADEVLSSNLESGDMGRWLSNIQKRADAIAKEQKDPFEIHDPKVYGQWSEKITLMPESIKSAAEIWKDHGQGLTTDDAFKLSTRWETWKKGTTPEDKKLDPVMADLRRDGAQRIGRARVAEEFDEETAGRLNLKWDQYIEDVRTGRIKATPVEVLEYFEELIGPEKESAIKEFLLKTLRNTLRRGPLVGPIVPFFEALRKERIGEKTDKALDEALGIREQAIGLLEAADPPYETTEENIKEAIRQIRDRK